MVNSSWKYPWHILNKKEIAYFLSVITVYVNEATPWKYGFIFCNWWIWTHKNWNAASRIKLKIICHKKASLILCPHTICWYIASPELVLRRWSSLPRMPRLLSYGWAVVRMPRLLIWQQLSTMKPSGASVEVASTQLCHPTSHLCNLALSLPFFSFTFQSLRIILFCLVLLFLPLILQSSFYLPICFPIILLYFTPHHFPFFYSLLHLIFLLLPTLSWLTANGQRWLSVVNTYTVSIFLLELILL